MAEPSKLPEILAEKRRQDSRNKIASTFRCTPETWTKLQDIQRVYDLKMNDTLEAIIEFAWQNL